MTKCVFCGTETHPSRGIHLIKNIGVIDFFCSKKCRLNSMKLGRDKRKVRWTEAARNKKVNTAAKLSKQVA